MNSCDKCSKECPHIKQCLNDDIQAELKDRVKHESNKEEQSTVSK